MSPELIALAEKRGALKARIAMQRDALGQHAWPVETVLGLADRGLEGVDWLKRHPQVLVAAAVALVVARPKRVWRLATRGFVLWRGAKGLQGRVQNLIQAVAGQARG